MLELGKQISLSGGVQNTLLNGGPTPQTALLTRPGDFDALFESFGKLRAVSYVASPELLLDFLTTRGFSQIEIVVGENLSQKEFKETLASKKVDIVEALAEKVEDGSLRILVPRRTIHSKLYILESPPMVRVIQGSANLTETAQEATNQINYVWYYDLPSGHPLVATFTRDYESHTKRCSVFMGDLLELLKERHDISRREIIEAWLTGATAVEPSPALPKILGELSAHALDPMDAESKVVFSLRLPDASSDRRETEKVLAKVGVKAVGNVAEVNRRAYFSYVEKTINVPLMAVDVDRRQVRLAMDGSLRTLNEEPPEPSAINRALDHLERYINTVELGQSPEPLVAKTAMFEAILYVLAAPFANEHMKIMRRSFGVQTTRRGPKWLYLYGPSSNGKTIFLQFALSLLTGQPTTPLEAGRFTKTRLKNATAFGTCFPVVFDDVKTTQQSAFGEVKSYWEVWWSPQQPSPQIIVSSNDPNLKDWAKSRVKRVDFNVHFTENSHNKVVLKEILEESNPLFQWFATLYLRALRHVEQPHDDELYLARGVIQDLYTRAGRELPLFFPDRPLEDIHDPGRSVWQELLFRSKQATPRLERNRLSVEFRDDLQRSDLAMYDAALPPIVKWERHGRTMTIDNPEDFFHWLGKKLPRRRGLLGRLLHH